MDSIGYIKLSNIQKFQLFIKYLLDRGFAFILIILLLPIFFIISLLILLEDGFPIFFIQERVGLNGKIFKMYKFRSFKKNVDLSNVYTYSQDPRISKVGKIIRRYSLDELPQLINIIKGEMSFIGPRPNLPFQYQELNDIQKQRYLVKPGITGLAQINGRNKINWEQRIYYDLIYIKNYSLFLDIWILYKTFFVVLSGEGVYEK
ncbi:MAG: sugar transferase [bacterium]|jgi:lipopolysaccharide/colanic/teichoic acid biosynthesis glycosyltransferase